MFQYVLVYFTRSMFRCVLVWFGLFLLCSGMIQCALVCSGMFWFLLHSDHSLSLIKGDASWGMLACTQEKQQRSGSSLTPLFPPVELKFLHLFPVSKCLGRSSSQSNTSFNTPCPTVPRSLSSLTAGPRELVAPEPPPTPEGPGPSWRDP